MVTSNQITAATRIAQPNQRLFDNATAPARHPLWILSRTQRLEASATLGCATHGYYVRELIVCRCLPVRPQASRHNAKAARHSPSDTRRRVPHATASGHREERRPSINRGLLPSVVRELVQRSCLARRVTRRCPPDSSRQVAIAPLPQPDPHRPRRLLGW